jgi:hypothetical protein
MYTKRATANDYQSIIPFHGFGAAEGGTIDGQPAPGLGIDLTSGLSSIPTWGWIVGGVLAYHLFVKKLW